MYRLLRAVWAVTTAAVVGAAIGAIVTVMRGEPSEDDVKTVYSLVAVFLCGGAAIAALHLFERASFRLLGAVVLVGAAVELVVLELILMMMTWRDLDSGGWAKTLAVLAILMVAGYFLGAIAQQGLRERAREA